MAKAEGYRLLALTSTPSRAEVLRAAGAVPLIGNLDCDPDTTGNQTSGFTLAPGAFLTCTGSYTVQQSDINSNGGGDGFLEGQWQSSGHAVAIRDRAGASAAGRGCARPHHPL